MQRSERLRARQEGDSIEDLSGKGGRRLRRITRHEREWPDPSTIWRGAGGVFVGIAAGAVLTAVAAAEGSVPAIPLPWAVAAASAIFAAFCLVAHWDVNRGRRIKRSEIVDEVEDGESGFS